MRAFLLALLACSPDTADAGSSYGPDTSPAELPAAGPGQAVAVFAGGCFWCMESDFDKMPGVVATTSGYAGGTLDHPTYEMVNTETTGHKESVRVVFDTSKITYAQVLDYYWHHVDPTDGGGQFCDRGDSYKTGIYPVDEAQRAEAEASKKAIETRGVLGKPIVTEIVPGQTFWPAEKYHQDFHTTNPGRYEPYRRGCGRDARVKQVWSGEK